MEKEILENARLAPDCPKAEELYPLERALFKVQRIIKPVRRDEKNDFAGGNYASLEAVLDEVIPAFEEAGLVLMQLPSTDFRYEKPMVNVTTKIIHWQSGQNLTHTIELPIVQGAKMNEIQAIGSAITYARRYSLLSILGMSTEDDDGNGGAGGTKAPKPKGSNQPAQPARELTPEEKKARFAKSINYYLTDQNKGLGKTAEEAQEYINDYFGGEKVTLEALTEKQMSELYRQIKAMIDKKG